ncbi:MAG: hypothetical protein L6Q99_14415 [Planctomycetes bacterium]|nr:hypothetical protein [Planctomycetota bacterium]
MIVGQGTAPRKVKYAGGQVRVQNVNSSHGDVIADLEFDVAVWVENCTRPVGFDRALAHVGFAVDGSSAVRSYGSPFTGTAHGVRPSTDHAFEIRGSPVALAESTVAGPSGEDIHEWGTPGEGIPGLLALASRLLLARSSVRGGNGGIELPTGRKPIVVDVPGRAEDVLVAPQRTFQFGQVGGSGGVGAHYPTPAGVPEGFTCFAQAKYTVAAGGERDTHSVPIVLR